MAIIHEIFRNSGGDGLLNIFDSDFKDYNKVHEGIRQFDAKKHRVMDRSYYKDKTIFVPTGEKDENGNDKVTAEIARVARVPLAIQRYIIEQKAMFAFSGGVELVSSDDESVLFERVQQNWDESKLAFDLTEIAEYVMSETQVALLFHSPDEEAESLEDFRFKYRILANSLGDKLTPHFDDITGDMIAFTRGYEVGEDIYKDIYWTSENGVVLTRFVNEVHESDISLPYEKLPIIYWEQDAPECDQTEEVISRFEESASRFYTQNDYTGDPILFLKGQVMDLPAKGEQGKVLESTDKDADAKLLESSSAHQARKLEFQMLEKFAFMLNRSAPLDVLTLRDMAVDSGEGMQRMLIDIYAEAHRKQNGYLGKGVQRAVNWLVHEWGRLMNVNEKLRVEVKFNQLSVKGESEKIDLAMKANGGLPVVTHSTSVRMAGIESNVDEIVNNNNNGYNN